MTKRDAKILACGLLPDGLDVSKLSKAGRREIRAALDKLLALTALSSHHGEAP